MKKIIYLIITLLLFSKLSFANELEIDSLPELTLDELENLEELKPLPAQELPQLDIEKIREVENEKIIESDLPTIEESEVVIPITDKTQESGKISSNILTQEDKDNLGDGFKIIEKNNYLPFILYTLIFLLIVSAIIYFSRNQKEL